MPINARDRNLSDWLTRIRTGQTKLPRFQRYEAWGHANVSMLFNTILQDLPAGSLLVLEIGGGEEPFVSRAIEGAPEGEEHVTEHLLDGQQRITALWRGLLNNYPERTYFLYLSPDEETGMPHYVDSVSRSSRANDNRRYPLWADDPVQLWSRKMIPLDLLLPGERGIQEFMSWAGSAIDDLTERTNVTMTVMQVREKISAFNLPYLSLPTQTKPEVALDVFIRTNTTAEPLDDYDIVVAQVEAGTGESLHDLVAETKEICPAVTRYYSPEDLALAASALLQHRTPGKSTYLSREFGNKLIENWEKYQIGVKRTVAFLEEERVFDSDRLPTDVVVPMLVALWAEAPQGLDAEGRARSVLRKYLWRAFFSKRYERSTATRSLADYNELRPYVSDSGTPLPIILNEAENPLPEVSELVEAGWPKRKDRLARAILALSLRQGGLDLADGSSASVDNLPKREYHHLFPQAHLKKSDTADSKIFRSLNCALVSWRTNRTISSKEPERYLAERRQDGDPRDHEIKDRLASHLIPYGKMTAGDYDEFLQARAQMVEREMKDLCD